jgi:predicted transposase/invertase (TIGR01784 family)
MEGEEEQFFSAKNDYLFKRIFGSEGTNEPLCSLLRAILHVEITVVEIKNPDLMRFSYDDKQGILDVRAVINGREHVDIEIQVYYQEYFMKRTQFYLSRLYSTQIGEGKPYSDLHRAIVINILCGEKYKLPQEHWHNVYIFMEKTRYTPMPDEMLEVHFIELDKMMKIGQVDESDALTRWILFMNANSTQDMKAVARQDPAICKAYLLVEEFAKNKQERMAYEARQDFLRNQLTNELAAEERGKIEGLKEGKIEGTIQTAKAMIAAGVDIEIVCKATGLSPDDLT